MSYGIQCVFTQFMRRALVISHQKDIHSNGYQPSVVYYSTTYMTPKTRNMAAACELLLPRNTAVISKAKGLFE